jgi:hypothetical protein
VARIENSCQPYTGWERRNHDSMHLIICDVTVVSRVYWVDNFVIAVRLISVKISSLSAVA